MTAMVAILAGAPAGCPDEATTAGLRALALHAVEQNFELHVRHLLETRMREETAEQRQRMARGMDKAIRAYLHNRDAVEEWHCR